LDSEQGTGTVSGLLGNIVNDTMHFVDDLLARVNGAEVDTRNAVSDLVDVRGAEGSSEEMDSLRGTLNDLQAKMNKLGSKAKGN
jgi:hypothetical protein